MTYEPIVLEEWYVFGWMHFLRIRQDGSLEVVFDNGLNLHKCPDPDACLKVFRRPRAKGK